MSNVCMHASDILTLIKMYNYNAPINVIKKEISVSLKSMISKEELQYSSYPMMIRLWR